MYKPPPGPPPGWTQRNQFQPPPGPPPGWSDTAANTQQYQPPPGPPPAWTESNSSNHHHHQQQQDRPPVYQPPPGPPPGWPESTNTESKDIAEPPPYHNWEEAVPDTSTLPPPPSLSQFVSQTGNASEDDAERALAFVQSKPLWRPVPPSEVVYRSTLEGDIRPVRPAEYTGDLKVHNKGRWRGKSAKTCTDCVIISVLPLYYAMRDSPLHTERAKTIYFEVKIRGYHQRSLLSRQRDDCGLSIGFLAQPYPTWRSPGWERASIGVFSDDGGRFVNDPAGGRPFTTPFSAGETVGLGMTFSLPEDSSSQYPGGRPPQAPIKPKVKVFLTRNGREAGGWDLDEEVDAEAGGVDGLEGDFDLYGAIGIFGGVEFEACFERSGWLWNGTSR